MDWSTILTPENTAAIVNLAVSLLVGIIGMLVTALSPKIMGFVKAKTTEQQFQTLEYVVTQSVRFAEQAFNEYGGEEKFDAAYKFASETLANRGVKVSAQTLEGLIEAAVLKEFNPPRPAEITSPQPEESSGDAEPVTDPEPGWEDTGGEPA